jgi:hypothetical protein
VEDIASEELPVLVKLLNTLLLLLLLLLLRCCR